MSYYISVLFNLPCESESRFTMYQNRDYLSEYPLSDYRSSHNLHLHAASVT